MSFDITSLFPDLESLTPDGRWNALQDWLAKNPEYQERVEQWSAQTVDQVFTEIQKLAIERYGVLAGFMISSPAIASKLRVTIETLQTLYRERAGETEKEIKNVNNVKAGTRSIRKRARRTSNKQR